ncbi:MAG: sulfite exporter TauE/SafE family protein [Actinomycetota bacterium]
MTGLQALVGVVAGFVSGVLSGMFGVGGGIIMTPAVQVLLGAPPIVALATPLPAIFPTALTGAATYGRAGQIDVRAAAWIVGPGVTSAIAGAALTDLIQTHVLLIVTAVLLAWQAVGILRGRSRSDASGGPGEGTPWRFAGVGLVGGFVSGLLGIGGGLVMVPLLAGVLGVPLKRALGTSLLAIVALVVPGSVVHAALGHIDWAICGVIVLGAVPGARVGSTLALGTRERTLRLLVGSFMLVVAVAYGAVEAVHLVRG